MDFGVVGLDGLMGSDSGFASLTSDPVTKQKWYGSGFLKQERSSTSGTTEDDWRSLKIPKTDDFSASKAMLLQQRSPLLRSNNNNSLFSDSQQHQQQQQMLSFSSPKSETLFLRNDSGVLDKNSQSTALPYFHQTSSACSRNTGYNSGSLLNAASMHGVLAGVRGPFTPSQWMELEHQALIYKYITANVPIPTNLLIPIRRALDSTGFSSFSGGPLRSNTLGWGSFHLGFSNNTDPEPGRCRRTDGKKWRCSRDAVADQKYCERHMNRGRHRSRKPVEGQSGHSVTAAAPATTTTTKLMPITSSSLASVVPGGASNSIVITHNQVKNLQSGASNNPSAATHINRIYMSKDNVGERMQETPGLSVLSPNINLNSKENTFSILKPRLSYEESPRTGFGLVSSDSLHNPSHKTSSFMNCRTFRSSQDLNNRESESQHSLRHFIDDWPKNQADRSAISWPDIDMQSDRTQLSISIPMASSDFMSSTSSPSTEKVAPSPLRLSRELDPIQMGLGVGSVLNEQNHRQANWIPITWETSMGGPLGEVLHKNNNTTTGDCKNSSVLNLMTDGWDGSPRLGSSPTGVLQKTSFGSLSNSSAGSSPRAENKTNEGASLCNDHHGSTLVNSSAMPSL